MLQYRLRPIPLPNTQRDYHSSVLKGLLCSVLRFMYSNRIKNDLKLSPGAAVSPTIQ